MKPDSTTPCVSVPNLLQYTEVATDFVCGMCRAAKVEEQRINHLCLAVEEAFVNAVQHGFPEEQKAVVTLYFKLHAGRVCISLWYSGYPLDPNLLYARAESGRNTADSGLGLTLMFKMTDRVEFINHGREGQETRLTMQTGVRLKPPAELVDNKTLESGAPAAGKRLPYTVRGLKPEEAVEVARLAYLSYGDTYPYEDIYYPDRIRELNQKGDLKSFVAVTDEGEIISHAALTRSDENNPEMAELGLAFTKPGRRGLGCMNALWSALLDEAVSLDLLGAFILAVTSHPYTQKCAHSFGFSDCAFFASEVPGLRFNKISDSHHRESILVQCRLFRPPPDRPLFPPREHSEMVREICGRLESAPNLQKQASRIFPAGPGRLKVSSKPAFGTGHLRVVEFGSETLARIRATGLYFLMHDTAPLFLYLPLDSPHVPCLVRGLEADPGWFFAGIIPNAQSGFDLVMQNSGRYRTDYEALAPASPESRCFLDYIRACDAGSGSGAQS